MFLEFQQMQPKNNLAHEIPGKLRETIGTDIFTLNNKNYLHIVDYHDKFPIVKSIISW